MADGGYVDAGAGYQTPDLSDIWYQGDATHGSQSLWIRVYDGQDWSSWDEFVLMTVSSNTAPAATVEDQTVEVEEWIPLNTVLNVSDADGDLITSYEVWDDDGGNSWWADGGYVDASTGYQTSNLVGIWFQGDSSTGDQTLWVRAYDGHAWSVSDSFTLTISSSENQARTAIVADQSLSTLDWLRLEDVLTFNDADSDNVAEIELWDDVGGNSWWIAGSGFVDANTGFATNDFANVWIQADAAAGVQTMWVRGSDGTDYGVWDSFELMTV